MEWRTFLRAKIPTRKDPLGPNEQSPERHGSEVMPLIAYRIEDGGPTIDIASADRKWMKETTRGFANHCLPLRIANQAGWFVRSHEHLEVIWDGSSSVNGITITRGSMDAKFISSHFGHGVLTWRIPYLFRTPPGYNLYVRGPSNWCKDGASPLDGIVETDWAVSTFTMNWKITRIGKLISFEKGEPIAMIFPIARGELERFQPEIRSLADDPELESSFKEWGESRESFNLRRMHSKSTEPWQRHYFLGRTLKDESFRGHQVRLQIRNFK